MKLIYNTVTQSVDTQTDAEILFTEPCNRACDGKPRLTQYCKDYMRACDYRIALCIPEGMEFYKVVDGIVVEDLEAKELDVQKKSAVVEQTKLALISIEYNKMTEDILAKMEEVFSTSNSDTATADYNTWQVMVKREDIAPDIKVYAEGKLAQAEAYAMYRYNRINEFRAARTLILEG